MNKGVFWGLTSIGGAFLGADVVIGMAILFITWSLAYVLAIIKN